MKLLTQDIRTHRRCEFSVAVPDFAGNPFDTREMPAGNYTVQWWDTLTGEVLRSDAVSAGADGTLRLSVPDFVNDIAGKVSANTNDKFKMQNAK